MNVDETLTNIYKLWMEGSPNKNWQKQMEQDRGWELWEVVQGISISPALGEPRQLQNITGVYVFIDYGSGLDNITIIIIGV